MTDDQALDAAAARLAEARQQLAHEGGERTGMGQPRWEGLNDHEREMAVLDARNYLKAAARVGLVVAPEPGAGHVLGHWRARYRVRYRDEPDRSRTYEAWIGAGDPDEARALLSKHLTDPDVAGWELVELTDVTTGEPDVIATWAF